MRSWRFANSQCLENRIAIFERIHDNGRLKIEIMKTTALIVTFGLSAAAPLLADGTNVLTDEKSRVSYALGMMSANWQQQGVDMDPDSFTAGIEGRAGRRRRP